MDSTLLVMIVLMTIFLGIFIFYLIHLLLKWNRIRAQERERTNLNGPSVKTDGNDIVKIPTPKYRLELGGCYYLFDKGSEDGYRLVKAYLARSYSGITATHFNPSGLKKRLAPLESDFVWLTRKRTNNGELAVVAPTNLGFLLQELKDRIGSAKYMIYIDCLDRCYKDNGIERTDKFLKNLKKLVSRNEAVLLMSIEAAGTNRKTRDFLHKNFKQLGKKNKKNRSG